VWKLAGGRTFHAGRFAARLHERFRAAVAVEASQGARGCQPGPKTLPHGAGDLSGRRGGMVRHRQTRRCAGPGFDGPHLHLDRQPKPRSPISTLAGCMRRTKRSGPDPGSAGPAQAGSGWVARAVPEALPRCVGPAALLLWRPGCPDQGRGRPAGSASSPARGQVVAAVAIAEEDPVDRLGASWRAPRSRPGAASRHRFAQQRGAGGRGTRSAGIAAAVVDHPDVRQADRFAAVDHRKPG